MYNSKVNGNGRDWLEIALLEGLAFDPQMDSDGILADVDVGKPEFVWSELAGVK
jgi:hypothetical protein